MRPIRFLLADASVTPQQRTIPSDLNISPHQVLIAVIVTGAVTYAVQGTTDNVFAPGYDPDAPTSNWVELLADAATNSVESTDAWVAYRIIQLTGNGSIDCRFIQTGQR